LERACIGMPFFLKRQQLFLLYIWLYLYKLAWHVLLKFYIKLEKVKAMKKSEKHWATVRRVDDNAISILIKLNANKYSFGRSKGL
jgi:hypothetical protein